MEVIKHEVKLERSVKIILRILAIGVFLNVFAPFFAVKEALAEYLNGSLSVRLSGSVSCGGCN